VSTVFDVTGVAVDGGTSVAIDSGIDSITLTDDTTAPNVTIDVPQELESIVVEVPGIQGPPGVQNLYVQSDDPSKDGNGNTIWGTEQTNYIWIQT
jgi:hypothetical protein